MSIYLTDLTCILGSVDKVRLSVTPQFAMLKSTYPSEYLQLQNQGTNLSMNMLYKKRHEGRFRVYQISVRRVFLVSFGAVGAVVASLIVSPTVAVFVVMPAVGLILLSQALPFYLDQRKTVLSGKQYRKRRISGTWGIEEIWLEK